VPIGVRAADYCNHDGLHHCNFDSHKYLNFNSNKHSYHFSHSDDNLFRHNLADIVCDHKWNEFGFELRNFNTLLNSNFEHDLNQNQLCDFYSDYNV
jgi:hypothetical protein